MDPFKQYFYGTNIKVTVLSDTQVLKTAANGSKLLPKEEYKQALFMVANKGKDIFAPIIIADKE